MNKTSHDQIANHFYSLGVHSALASAGSTKTAASIKDIAKMLGRGTAHTLPTVGTVGGVGVGGLLGGAAGLDLMRAVENATQSLEASDRILAGLASLAGAGVTTGAGLVGGGVLGNKGGNMAKDKLLRVLAK